MREIKFRVWIEKLSCYADSAVVGHDGGFIAYKDGIQYVNGHVEQFTGINDRTGKPIYEGDIVRMVYIHDEGGGWKSKSKEIGKVYFSTHWGVKFDCRDFTQRIGEHWKLKASSFQDATDVEVIGNVNENPDMFMVKR